jgi:hypothetical protein
MMNIWKRKDLSDRPEMSEWITWPTSINRTYIQLIVFFNTTVVALYAFEVLKSPLANHNIFTSTNVAVWTSNPSYLR